jgi:hypothetical protein
VVSDDDVAPSQVQSLDNLQLHVKSTSILAGDEKSSKTLVVESRIRLFFGPIIKWQTPVQCAVRLLICAKSIISFPRAVPLCHSERRHQNPLFGFTFEHLMALACTSVLILRGRSKHGHGSTPPRLSRLLSHHRCHTPVIYRVARFADTNRAVEKTGKLFSSPSVF